MIQFEVPGRCVPAPRMTYYGKRSPRTLRYMSYRQDVARAAKAARIRATDQPVRVTMDIFLVKWGPGGDLDNYQKTILDALNGIAWRDDRQVMEILARKQYVGSVDEERVLVKIDTF